MNSVRNDGLHLPPAASSSSAAAQDLPATPKIPEVHQALGTQRRVRVVVLSASNEEDQATRNQMLKAIDFISLDNPQK